MAHSDVLHSFRPCFSTMRPGDGCFCTIIVKNPIIRRDACVGQVTWDTPCAVLHSVPTSRKINRQLTCHGRWAFAINNDDRPMVCTSYNFCGNNINMEMSDLENGGQRARALFSRHLQEEQNDGPGIHCASVLL